MKPAKLKPKTAYLIASGDLRLSANQVCWPAQQKMEAALSKAFAAQGWKIQRAHPVDRASGHGFISSQKMGIEIFRHLDPDAPLIVAEAVWQYSHHVLAGLTTHRGPILTIANWSGQWPGLVGLLNLNGSLVKAGVSFSTLWSENFDDDFFRSGLKEWIATGKITHDLSHVAPLKPEALPAESRELGRKLASDMKSRKIIMGIFDEGCMGMYNAIIDDELLNPSGFFQGAA